jgi:hypothetical protein
MCKLHKGKNGEKKLNELKFFRLIKGKDRTYEIYIREIEN